MQKLKKRFKKQINHKYRTKGEHHETQKSLNMESLKLSFKPVLEALDEIMSELYSGKKQVPNI